MLLHAMMLNPGGPNWGLVSLVLGGIGLVVGIAWIFRIAGIGEGGDRSSFRYRRR